MCAQPVQFMGQRQHQRGVPTGAHRDPVHRAAGFQVRRHRRDIDKLDPRRRHLPKPRAQVVPSNPGLADLGVFRRNPAEGQEQIAVFRQIVPAVVMGHQPVHRRHDMRQQHAGRRQRIAVAMGDITADRVQKPVQLALRVMEPAGRGPAIGAAKDCRVAMVAPHPVQFIPDQGKGGVPVDLDKGLAAAQVGARAGALLQPALTDCRAPDAAGGDFRRQHVQTDRAGIRVGLQPLQARAASALVNFVGAPMRHGIARGRHRQYPRSGSTRLIMSRPPASQASRFLSSWSLNGAMPLPSFHEICGVMVTAGW